MRTVKEQTKKEMKEECARQTDHKGIKSRSEKKDREGGGKGGGRQARRPRSNSASCLIQEKLRSRTREEETTPKEKAERGKRTDGKQIEGNGGHRRRQELHNSTQREAKRGRAKRE